jgi:hypothetical protein
MGTWLFFPIFGGMTLFLADRPMVSKELKVGCYLLSAYYVARTLLTLPLEFVWPTLWITCFFWATRLSPYPIAYVLMMLLCYLNYVVFQSVGLLMSASNMPLSRANTVNLLLITYLFAWSGLMMDMRRVPGWLHWASDGNIFAASIRVAFRIVTEGVDYTCSSSGSGSPEGCNDGVLTGSEAREWLGVGGSPLVYVLGLVLLLLICRLLSFALLRYSLRDAIDGARGACPQQQAQGLESVGKGPVEEAGDKLLESAGKGRTVEVMDPARVEVMILEPVEEAGNKILESIGKGHTVEVIDHAPVEEAGNKMGAHVSGCPWTWLC